VTLASFPFQVPPPCTYVLIKVNMWPSPVGDGTMDVSIEYEVDGGTVPEDLVVIIPVPMQSLILFWSDVL
jgi:hypothetical protein